MDWALSIDTFIVFKRKEEKLNNLKRETKEKNHSNINTNTLVSPKINFLL